MPDPKCDGDGLQQEEPAAGIARRNRTIPPSIILFTAVAGIIAFQMAVSFFNTAEAPLRGPHRGDLELTEDSLDVNHGGWQRESFLPALAMSEMPRNRWWWSHGWIYSKYDERAFVSFDQLGHHGWHDLYRCYEAKGWSLQRREICDPGTEVHWPYVRCELTHPEQGTGILYYSIFDQTATPIPPTESPLRTGSSLDRLKSRLLNAGRSNSQENGRTNQCQVFIVSRDSQPDSMELGTRLHVETRARFADHWRQKNQQP